MTRFSTVFLLIAAVAFICNLSSVAAECSQAMVGKTYPTNSPKVYYTCKDVDTTIYLVCPTGTGYINNGVMAGCVPWELWTCTSKAPSPVCTPSNIGQTYPTTSPETYWKCFVVGAPTLMNCPSGTGFQQPTSCSGSVSGSCVAWSVWWTTCPN